MSCVASARSLRNARNKGGPRFAGEGKAVMGSRNHKKGYYCIASEPVAEKPATAASSPEPSPQQGQPAAPAPATFSLLYESGDGCLCTFEDADGHLTSVDARRFV